MPDTKFDSFRGYHQSFKIKGFKVSVDSANQDELIRGSNAGADFILSLNEKNINLLNQCKKFL